MTVSQMGDGKIEAGIYRNVADHNWKTAQPYHGRCLFSF
jgi:hypothetical protein